MKVFLFGLFLLLSVATMKAQSTGYFITNIGYTNLNGNYLELGADYYLVKKNDNILDFGASANLAYFEDEFVVIPEASVGYIFNFGKKSGLDPYSEEFNAGFYVVRLSASPYHITPEIGISLLSLVEINAGWGFEFNEHDDAHFNGLKLGINIRIPTLLFGGSNF